jgi:hypothetical protein
LKDKDMKISIEDEVSEDDQVEQVIPQQKLYTMPRDPSDHEFVEMLDRSVEVEHFQQAELKQKLNLMTMEASVHVSVTQPEEKKVQQAEVNQELDSIPIHPMEHSGEELEGEKTAQAGLEQEWDSVPVDSREHAFMTSYAHTDDEQAERKQKVTSVMEDVLEYAADTFNDDTNTWKG